MMNCFMQLTNCYDETVHVQSKMLQASKVWDCNFYVKSIEQKKCCYSNTDDVLKNPTHSNIKSQTENEN